MQSGQTAWAIALRYGLPLDELLALNNLGPDSILHPGDELILRRPEPTATPSLAATGPVAAPPSPTTGGPPAATAALTIPAAVALASPVIRVATMTPTPAPTTSPSSTPSARDNGPVDRQHTGEGLVLLGLAIGAGLAAVALAAAVVGNILERRR